MSTAAASTINRDRPTSALCIRCHASGFDADVTGRKRSASRCPDCKGSGRYLHHVAKTASKSGSDDAAAAPAPNRKKRQARVGGAHVVEAVSKGAPTQPDLGAAAVGNEAGAEVELADRDAAGDGDVAVGPLGVQPSKVSDAAGCGDGGDGDASLPRSQAEDAAVREQLEWHTVFQGRPGQGPAITANLTTLDVQFSDQPRMIVYNPELASWIIVTTKRSGTVTPGFIELEPADFYQLAVLQSEGLTKQEALQKLGAL